MLFLDRELAESLDVRDGRTATIRTQLQGILADRMRGTREHSPVEDKPPVLPPLPDVSSEDLQANARANRAELSPELPKQQHEEFKMQLPPLDFGHEDEPPSVPDKRVLTPITERSTSGDPSRSLSTEEPASKAPSAQVNSPPKIPETKEEGTRVLGGDVVSSPTATSPPATSPTLPPIPVYDRGRRNPSFEVLRPQPKPQRPEPEREESKPSTSFATGPQAPNTNTQAPTSLKPETRSAVTVSAQASPPPPTASSGHTQTADRPVPTRSPAAVSVSSHQSPRPTSPQVPPKSPTVSSRAPSSLVVPQTPASSTAKALPQTPLTTSSNSSSVVTPQSPPLAKTPTPPPPQSVSDDFSHAAGALYFMSQMQHEPVQDTPVKFNPARYMSKTDDDYDSPSEYSQSYTSHRTQSMNTRHTSPPSSFTERPATTRRDTANSMASSRSNLAGASVEAPAIAASTSRSGTGRKPSGARAAPASKIHSSRHSFAPDQSLHGRDDEPAHDDDMVDLHDAPPQVARAQHALDDPDADALAALTFLEQGDNDTADTGASQRQPAASSSTQAVPQVVEPASSPGKSPRPREYRSSFQPSKQAAERKAKVQAQQAAQQAAVSRPGRANGKRVSSRGAWAESSDEEEEEEEEEEEDEDADSDEEPAPRMPSGQQSASGSIAPSQSGSTANLSGRGPSPAAPDANGAYPARRPPRELPQVPNPNQPYPGMQGTLYLALRWLCLTAGL